jgi:hypothetical protein
VKAFLRFLRGWPAAIALLAYPLAVLVIWPGDHDVWRRIALMEPWFVLYFWLMHGRR